MRKEEFIVFKEYLGYITEAAGNLMNHIIRLLPGILGAILIVVVTLLLAKLIKNLTVKILRAVGINVLSKRTGMDKLLEPIELASGFSELIGIIIYWLILFFGLAYALKVAGFMTARILLDNVILYIPKVFLSIILLVVGTNIASFLGALAEKAGLGARIGYAKTIGYIVKCIFILITIVSIIEALSVNLEFIKVFIYILLGCAAAIITIIFGVSGIQTGKDLVAFIFIKKVVKPGDILIWEHRQVVVENITTVFTQTKCGTQSIYIPHSLLLKDLKVVNQDKVP